MPIDRTRYRSDWNDFSHSLKSAANWTCQGCGKPCRQYRESLETFANRVFAPRSAAWLDAMQYPQKFCLTVAHLDQNPANDEPDNVLALCSPCHLNYDRPDLVRNAYAKLERNGQGVLRFGEIARTLTSRNPKRKFCNPFGWSAIETGLDISLLETESKQYSLLILFNQSTLEESQNVPI